MKLMNNKSLNKRVTMKRLMMLVLALVVNIAALAQSKNVNKANAALEKQEYAEAIALIEPALVHEKTANKGRTWYIRGQIYGEIAKSEDEQVQALDPDAIKKGIESYRKVRELEKESSSYYNLAEINLNQLIGGVLNKGVAAFQEDDFEGALDAFDLYTKVMPDDTTGFIYAALMSQQLERYDKVVNYYEGVFNLDYYPTTALNAVIYYELNELDNPEKALDFARLAQTQYPDDNGFKKTEVDILIKMKKLDEAIKALQNAIAAEPENASLYSNLGLLYDAQEKYDLAIEQYEKALEYNPSDRFSLINLAVFYIGKGDKINKAAIDMDVATYRKEGGKLEEEAKLDWEKAIPYLEKVLEDDDTDELALQNLHAVYFKLKDYKNAVKMEDRRKELGYLSDDN
jgi:tetratricopeptide (TPR) repeat protein